MLDEARDIVEMCQADEQMAYDNLPEGVQYSDRGCEMEENATELEEACDSINEVIDCINGVIEK